MHRAGAVAQRQHCCDIIWTKWFAVRTRRCHIRAGAMHNQGYESPPRMHRQGFAAHTADRVANHRLRHLKVCTSMYGLDSINRQLRRNLLPDLCKGGDEGPLALLLSPLHADMRQSLSVPHPDRPAAPTVRARRAHVLRILTSIQ